MDQHQVVGRHRDAAGAVHAVTFRQLIDPPDQPETWVQWC